MRKLAAAVTALTLLLATPALAQRPLSANQLPNSGVVNYEGTFSGFDFTAPISITADFDGDGGFIATSAAIGSYFQTLIGSSSLVILAGNFFTGQAKTAAGEFIAQFCFEDCGVIRTRNGEFSATRVQ